MDGTELSSQENLQGHTSGLTASGSQILVHPKSGPLRPSDFCALLETKHDVALHHLSACCELILDPLHFMRS